MELKIPYMNKQELSEAFSLSRSTIQHRIGEIEASGRYGNYAILRDGQILLVNTLVFVDWLRYRRHWQDKNLRKHIPPFDAKQVAAQMGWEITKVSLRRVEI